MIRELAEGSDELAAICADHRVASLEAFGSAVTEESGDEVRDLDFLVEFLPCGPGEYFDAYFGLLECLHRLFGRPVDLVASHAIRNPYVLDSVNRSRTPLYAA